MPIICGGSLYVAGFFSGEVLHSTRQSAKSSKMKFLHSLHATEDSMMFLSVLKGQGVTICHALPVLSTSYGMNTPEGMGSKVMILS